MAFYFINFKTDEGRFKMLKPIADKMNGEIIQIDSVVQVDKDGIPYNYKDTTIAMKEAKMKLFAKFLHDYPEEQHLWLMEDNLIPHKDFDNLFEKVKKFVADMMPTVAVLGAGNHSFTDNLFNPLIDTEKINGSYAVIYHRDIIRMILAVWIKNNKDVPINDVNTNYSFDEYYLKSVQTAFPDKIMVMHPGLFAKYPEYNGFEFTNEIIVRNEMKNIIPDNYSELINPIPLITTDPMDNSMMRWYPYVRPCRTIPQKCTDFIVIQSRTILLWKNDITLDGLLSKPGKYPVHTCPRCTKHINAIGNEFVWIISGGQQTLEITRDPVIFISRTRCTEVYKSDHSVSLDELRIIKPYAISTIMQGIIRHLVNVDGSVIKRPMVLSLKKMFNTYDDRFTVTTNNGLFTVTLRVDGISDKVSWRII